MTSPLKWHGGKHYLAKQIINLFPPRDGTWCHYVEPFFGGGSVLLANNPNGISEVANDVDYRLTNFWTVIADVDTFESFRRFVEGIPFCEPTYQESADFHQQKHRPGEPCVGCAVTFFVHCRQSLAGRMGTFAPITKNRTRRGMNEQASAWLGAVDGLPMVHERLRRVVILNRKAKDVIIQQDGPRTLFYFDPPYVAATRSSPEVYANEMDDMDHAFFLAQLAHIKGRFLLSGYHHPLYDEAARVRGWKCHEFNLPNNAAGGNSKRRMTECVWTNYQGGEG